MTRSVDISLATILGALAILKESGLDVKEIEASPLAFNGLLENFPPVDGSARSGGDSVSVTIDYYGDSVRVTRKPVAKFGLELG